MLSLLRVLLPLLLLLSTTTLQATTFHVSTSGSDATSCGEGPRRTINGGIACLNGGDTLEVQSGTYQECLNSAGAAHAGLTRIPSGASWSQPTVLKAAPGATVWLTPPANACDPGQRGNYSLLELSEARDYYVIIDGLNLDVADRESFCTATNNARHLRLQNMEIKNSSRVCMGGGGAGDVHFLNLRVHHCGISPFSEAGAHCYYFTGSQGFVIEGGSVSYANNYGLQFSSEGRFGSGIVRGVHIHHNPMAGNGGFGMHLYNNIFTDNGGPFQAIGTIGFDNNTFFNNSGTHVELAFGANGQTLRNNIFLGGGTPIEFREPGSPSGIVAHNNLCSSTGMLGCTHSGTVSATWENAAGGDFRLKAGSTAVDTGANLAEAGFSTDMTGRSRAPAWDLGACEAGAPVGPVAGGGGPTTLSKPPAPKNLCVIVLP